MPRSEEERSERRRKRVELKDPDALCIMAMMYGRGQNGLPVDQAKCIELLRQSASLGCPGAQFTLGNFYDIGAMGLEQNKEKATEYWKKAAEDGHVISRHNLGCEDDDNGDVVAAMRHWRLAASGGVRSSMNNVIARFELGLLHHANLAETAQAFYLARSEIKSEDRDQYMKHLKMIGEYEEEYDNFN